jgi:hypothetical protein
MGNKGYWVCWGNMVENVEDNLWFMNARSTLRQALIMLRMTNRGRTGPGTQPNL